ncbi:MAG: cupin domain-containing protein [Myxococcota bacterium]
MSEPLNLQRTPIHLGLNARAIPQPAFTGGAWYADYASRVDSDGIEGRLVSMHTFSAPWDSWEMHPHGDELVLCVSGSLRLIQEIDGRPVSIQLNPGEAAINPSGVWHTADVSTPTTAVFITAGRDTQARPRDATPTR